MKHKELTQAHSASGEEVSQESQTAASKSLNSPSIKQVEFDDLLAHRVFEKVKKRITAYYALLAILGGLVIAVFSWAKIDSTIDARIKEIVDPALTNAQKRVDNLNESFQKKLNDLRMHAEQRTSELDRQIGVSLIRIQSWWNTNLALEIDISSSIGRIRNQGNTASSVGYSLAYALRSESTRAGRYPGVEFSGYGIYIEAQRADNMPLNDLSGVSFKAAGKALQLVGAYASADWVIGEKQPRAGATPVCKISEWKPLTPLRSEDVIDYLKAGRPVVVGLSLYSDTFNNPGGLFTIGKVSSLEVHPVCVVGYSEQKQLFKVANTWGTDWGANGFGYVAKGDFTNLCVDACVISLAPEVQSH
jgi:hypothetical protein